MTPREREIRLWLREDFEYYAPRCLKIREDGTTDQRWQYFLTLGGIEFYRQMVDRGEYVMVICAQKQMEGANTRIGHKMFDIFVTDAATANRLIEFYEN